MDDSRKRSHIESGLRVLQPSQTGVHGKHEAVKAKVNMPTQAEIEAFQSQLTSESIKNLA